MYFYKMENPGYILDLLLSNINLVCKCERLCGNYYQLILIRL